MVTKLAEAGVAKRHQQTKKKTKALFKRLFTDNRCKNICKSNGLPGTTKGTKHLLSLLGYEIMGLIAENAQDEAMRRRRKTVKSPHVVAALSKRGRIIVATALQPKKKKKKVTKTAPDAPAA